MIDDMVVFNVMLIRPYCGVPAGRHRIVPSASGYKEAPESCDFRGSVKRYRAMSRNHTLNLAGLEALDAHADANVLAVNGGTNRLQVRAEGALVADMRVRNGVSDLRTLAAHCTTSCMMDSLNNLDVQVFRVPARMLEHTTSQ